VHQRLARIANLPLHPATEANPDNHAPVTAIRNKHAGAISR
jgi:hypothetical protein